MASSKPCTTPLPACARHMIRVCLESFILRQVTLAFSFPERRAAWALVVQPSIPRCVIASLTIVLNTASAAICASYGKNARASSHRNRLFFREASVCRMGWLFIRLRSAVQKPVKTGTARTSTLATVQVPGLPGRKSQPATINNSKAGATRLLRRLSRIFQRLIVDSLGENNHGRSCQSPRVQRCSRLACTK